MNIDTSIVLRLRIILCIMLVLGFYIITIFSISPGLGSTELSPPKYAKERNVLTTATAHCLILFAGDLVIIR